MRHREALFQTAVLSFLGVEWPPRPHEEPESNLCEHCPLDTCARQFGDPCPMTA